MGVKVTIFFFFYMTFITRLIQLSTTIMNQLNYGLRFLYFQGLTSYDYSVRKLVRIMLEQDWDTLPLFPPAALISVFCHRDWLGNVQLPFNICFNNFFFFVFILRGFWLLIPLLVLFLINVGKFECLRVIL